MSDYLEHLLEVNSIKDDEIKVLQALREKDLARIAELEEALQSLDVYLSYASGGDAESYRLGKDVISEILANKSDWLAKHDEPLLAKIAMLTETTEYARDVAKNNKLDSVVYSLNVTLSATESEVEAWLQKRDAEVRRTTLVNMRNSINTSLNPFTGDTAQDVVNQINNVLDGEEYLCRLTQEKTK